MRKVNRIPRPRRTAFSLIETVLALGIIASVLTALIGLLPSALESSQLAGRQRAMALIAQTLHSYRVAELTGKELLFDDHGSRCETDQRHAAAYAVTVQTGLSRCLPGEITGSLPEATATVRSLRGHWQTSFTFSQPP